MDSFTDRNPFPSQNSTFESNSTILNTDLQKLTTHYDTNIYIVQLYNYLHTHIDIKREIVPECCRQRAREEEKKNTIRERERD